MIMLNTLKRDFQRYERGDGALEEGQEETGWKLVHGDVFRPPVMAGWLTVMVGTGVQLGISLLFLISFACFGFLSPANRGVLMQSMLFLFVFMGTFGGFTSARLFRMFKGTRWRSNGLWTALLFPGITFAIFFTLNLFIWGEKSSGAATRTHTHARTHTRMHARMHADATTRTHTYTCTHTVTQKHRFACLC